MNKYLIFSYLFFACLLFSNLKAQVSEADYTSKVPKFKFSDNLKEQENQLKTNPLMLRFAKSREEMKNDRYRPNYHFVNPEGKLNDPNGLCYWQGRWHLFYQAYPPEDPRQHWGHAVSDDLVHWRDLPYAIYPNPEYQCFSGATLVEDDRVIAMYHGTRLGNMVATANDPLLLNWNKLGDGAVIPIHEGDNLPYYVFDPNIWKKDGVYYSMSAGRSKENKFGQTPLSTYLFKSNDLLNWDYLHEFIENDHFTKPQDDGACPYFWPIGSQYILPFYSHVSGGQYFLGDYDKSSDKFIATNHGKFNFGAFKPGGIHAPSATPYPNSKDVVIIFNMNPGKPTDGWNQIMSLPRRLSIKNRDTLYQEPAGDLESLRYNKVSIKPQIIEANKELVLDGVQGDVMEIVAEFEVKDVPMFELNVLRSKDKEEYTRIAFYRERGMNAGREYANSSLNRYTRNKFNSLLTLDNSHASLLPDVMSRAPETGSFYLEPEETLKLRIFVDKSVVEVFANGKLCVAARVYPSLEDSVGVSVRSQGQDSKLISLDAYQMRNIYE